MPMPMMTRQSSKVVVDGWFAVREYAAACIGKVGKVCSTTNMIPQEPVGGKLSTNFSV